MTPPRRRRLRSDPSLAVVVAVALFAVYVAVTRGQIKSYDGSIMINLATRLLTKRALTIDPRVDSLHLQHPYTSYGFGTSLVALPFVALQRAVDSRSQTLLSLASPVLLAASGALLFLIGLRLGWRRAVCVLTALGFGLLTPALWQSTEMLSETGVTVATLLIVLGVLRWRDSPRSSSILVGVGAAAAVLYRPDSLVLVVPFAMVVFFLVPRDVVLTRVTLVAVGAPMVAVAAFQLWYDDLRYGSVLSTGMSQQARGQGFDTPLFRGLDLLLRSPSRGFFWSSLILLLALPGIALLYRRNRPVAIGIGALVVARFLFYARWFTPGGGVAWGPRLLFPVTALLSIAAGEAVESIWQLRSVARRRAAWAAVAVLALASAGVSFLSVAIGYEVYWNRWTHVPPDAVAARAHSYYWSLRHNVIVGNFHLLRSGATVAPMHFRNGPDAVGIVALAVACVAIVVAAFAARDPAPATTADVTLPGRADDLELGSDRAPAS
jgi:hypothetical protein